MRKKITLIIMLCMVFMLGITANAATVKKYKASKVTAKQIVTELKKLMPVTKPFKHKDVTEGILNSFKTKYGFYDKKYKKTYCTVEVFADAYDANRRCAWLEAYDLLCANLFPDQELEVPVLSYRYKNIVIRLSNDMPYKRAKQYYAALKKIVK